MVFVVELCLSIQGLKFVILIEIRVLYREKLYDRIIRFNYIVFIDLKNYISNKKVCSLILILLFF